MSMTNTDRENWRKALGIKEPSTALDAGRVGTDIGKKVGRAGGASSGGSIDSDTIPEGDDEQGAEKGDGAADAGKQLKVGDEFDRLEDLYDCETGEEVTIDGFGGKGSESYPTGFDAESCETGEAECNIPPSTMMIRFRTSLPSEPLAWGSWYIDPDEWKAACQSAGHNVDENHGTCNYKPPNSGQTVASERKIFGDLTPQEQKDYCDNRVKWPAVDRNHLTWNKEKGCFEPLCQKLNNQVLDKYKACEPERILCDKDGNKVKVTIDGDTVKVTQAKYNQTAEIKNGKVQAVKKLTESQTEAEFK